MQIALAQLNYHIGNFEGNAAKMRNAIDEAVQQGADLVIFSELSICGYPPRDFLEFPDFIDRCLAVVDELAVYAAPHDLGVIVGAPARNPVVEGKDLFNAAYLLYQGEIKHVSHKALLPTYDIFDEYRYFEPGQEFSVVEFKGKRLAITICEDLWNVGNENPLYRICPMDLMVDQNPELIINISASPFDYVQAEERLGVLRANTDRYHLPILYCNHTGAQTEIIFDGGSVAMNDRGQVVEELPFFEETIRLFRWEELFQATNPISEEKTQPKEKYDLIYRALVEGIRNYFGKLGFSKAILGLSGGIDSALTLILAADALGAENVKAVLMPSQYSSGHSVTDAEMIARNAGVTFETIPIKSVYESFLDQLQPRFDNKPFDVTEENIQARIRAVYLMALSNKHGYILLNTSNKSEAAVGYGTLYGDMCGGLSVLGDVYKTEVYGLSLWINKSRPDLIPNSILTKPPSAELRPDQKDEDSLPPYDLLDQVLFQYIEHRKGPRELVEMGFEQTLVNRVLKLVNTSEYKRYQTPPMLRVSPKAFGMGRRMPIVAKYLS